MSGYRANFDVMFSEITRSLIESTNRSIDTASKWTNTNSNVRTITVDGRDAVLITR